MYLLQKHSAILIIICALSLTTCKRENMCDCVKSTGSTTTEYRTLSAFDKIYADDKINVFITSDSTQEVKVEAGKHLINLITTEVTDGELFIKNRNKCNWVRSYKKEINVYIKMPKLTSLDNEGNGDIITTDTIYGSSLFIRQHGAGNITIIANIPTISADLFGVGDLTIKGKSSNWECSMGGNGFLYASDMHAGYTWVSNNSTGNAYVSAPDWLRIFIYSEGDIYYSGNPSTIQKTVQGTGNLIKQ